MWGGTWKAVAAGVKLACCRASTFLRIAVLSLAGLLALAFFGFGPAAAQETFSIRGTVVNGTAGSELGEELQVLLLVTDADGGLLATGQTSVDPDGLFVLDEIPETEDGTYALRVNFNGVPYERSLSLEEALDEVLLTVYEATQDASMVRVTRQIMVIAGVDAGNREVAAIEFVQLTNGGDRTLLPDLANPATLSFLRFALPPLATDLSVRSNLPGGDIVSIGTGFAITSTVLPGDHNVEFSFRFPYEGNSVSYRQSLPQGADIYQVLLPQGLEQVRVRPLRPAPPANIEGGEFLVWEERGIERGQGIALEFTNLPQPGLASRMWKVVSGEVFWQIVIPSVVGAALATLLLLGILRSQHRPPLPDGQSGGGTDSTMAQREALVREVASLDEEFDNGTLPAEDYLRQRERLLSRIRGVTGQADDPGDGPL